MTRLTLPALSAVVVISSALVLAACGSSDEKTSTASRGNPSSIGERPACYPDCVRANLDGANLARVNLDGIDLRRASMVNAYLYSSSLRNAKMSQAILTRSSLGNADLTNADLSNAGLDRASLRGATMTGASLAGARFFQTTCPDGTQTAPPASKPPTCKIN